MNLRHLMFFRELAKTQHMSKAAENLGISQPSLSYAIDNLEKELGVPLFERDGRNIRISHFGEIYLNFVNSGLTEIERGNSILKQLLNVNEGNIKLGFTYTLGHQLIPELISSFHKQDTDQHITFELAQSNTLDLLKGLINEKYDFVLSSRINKIDDQHISENLNFIPLIKQEIKVAVPIDHPLANKKSVSMQEVVKYPQIYFSKTSGLRPLIDRIYKNAKVKPNINYEIEDDNTIIGFIQYDLGIALVPNLPILDQNQVKLISIKDNQINHQIYMVLKNNRFLAPSVSKFQNFITKYCNEQYNKQNKMI